MSEVRKQKGPSCQKIWWILVKHLCFSVTVITNCTSINKKTNEFVTYWIVNFLIKFLSHLCSQKGDLKGAMHSLHTAFVLKRFEAGQ